MQPALDMAKAVVLAILNSGRRPAAALCLRHPRRFPERRRHQEIDHAQVSTVDQVKRDEVAKNHSSITSSSMENGLRDREF